MMKPILRHTLLAVILVGLGWKVYTHLNPKPDAEPEPTPEPHEKVLAVGDLEEEIERFFGTPAGVSAKSGIKTYYFEGMEIDAKNGTVAAIRKTSGITGTLELGERKVVIDQANQIKER